MLHSYSRIATSPPPTPARLPSWSPGELAATHEAYRAALRVIAPQTDDQTSFAETFAESWIATRDLIGVAAATGTDLHLAGWHLDDLATLRAVDNSTVLVGSDANQTVALVEALLHWRGIVYVRARCASRGRRHRRRRGSLARRRTW